MRKLRLNRRLKTIGIGVLAVLLCVLVWAFWPGKQITAQGISYLEEQENKKVKDLSSKLKEKKNAEMESAIDAGTIDVFALFDDAVIFGDSRVLGFSTYNYFPSSQVYADGGATIKNITDYIDQVKSAQPSLIFFSYGVNDMGLSLDDEEGGYGGLYQSQIEQVVAVCPDATIVVNSIISPTPAAIQESPRWDKVDQYNTEIKSMCEKNDWIYVDNSDICKNGQADIYQADGIHFLSTFYSTWAENMIMTVREQG